MSTIPKITKIFKRICNSTLFLTFGMFLIGAIIMLGGIAILETIYDESVPDAKLGFVIIIASMFFLVSGIVMIKRQELPRLGLPSITGFWAVINGWAMVIGVVLLLFFTVVGLFFKGQ